MKTKLRIIYGIMFLAILVTEVCIALFVDDSFVRPYVGDMLVTVLICCFLRVFIPNKVRLLPLFVFVFAALVEIGQYFDFVKLLGLGDNKFFSVLLCRHFDVRDIICYAVGCAVFAALEYAVKRVVEKWQTE